jgi:hypothetical protein
MISRAWTVHAITLPALSRPIALSLNKHQKGMYLYTQLLSLPPKTFSNAGIMLSNLSIDSSAKSDGERIGGILGTHEWRSPSFTPSGYKTGTERTFIANSLWHFAD